MKEYKCYIFDFDGTIMDSFETLYLLFADAFNKINIKIEKEDILDIARIPIIEAYYKYGGKEDEDDKKVFEKALFEGLGNKEFQSYTNIYSDAKELIEHLINKNAKLGIVSNGDKNAMIKNLRNFNIDSDKFVIVGHNECEEKKPSGGPLLKCLELMGYKDKKDDVVMIGDSINDVLCGENAGVNSVLIERYNEYNDYQNDKIKSLRELIV